LRVLMLGDIVGRPGRRAVQELLPSLLKDYQPDLVIANGENAAGGNGITKEVAEELFNQGIDLLTMGNHVWDRQGTAELLEEEKRIIRPANYPPGVPGRGFVLLEVKGLLKIGIINLQGRIFMPPSDCPFRVARALVEELKRETPMILIDFHAEATSEKVALGWYLDGEVSAVLGTHTHVQTADARLLPEGTAYITDVGMTGPRDSVLGLDPQAIIKRFLTQMPVRFDLAREGPLQVEGVAVDIDPFTGRALNIQRIQRYL